MSSKWEIKSFCKVISCYEDEKMSKDFENSHEYIKELEIVKRQEEFYKNVTEVNSPEALARFQELSNKNYVKGKQG